MATRNNKKAAAAAGDATEGLKVTAKVDGFRRGGREWHGTTTVSLAELTPEQLEAIEGEPLLVTERVPFESD